MVLIEARDGHPTDIESRSRMNCMSLKRWFEILWRTRQIGRASP